MDQIERAQEQKYQRVTAILKAWRKQTSLACSAYYEAKQTECWRLHHNSWKEFIEALGFTEEWARQLALTGERMAEMTALLTAGSGATELHPSPQISSKIAGLTPNIRKVLDGIPTATQLAVLAKTSSNKPTIKEVKSLVVQTAEKQQTQEVDRWNHDITKDIEADWQRGREFNQVLTRLSQIKVQVEKGLAEHDHLFAEITNTTPGHLANAYSTLCRVIPYTVCPRCSGHKPKDKCGKKGFCNGRGFVSEFQFGLLDKKTKEEWTRK